MECIVCGTGISKKARTCSAKCRQIASRSKASVTNLEQCRYCEVALPKLAKPRRWPGACYECAITRPRKCSLDALGDTVWVGSERLKERIA